jgi:hypothetical protein
MGPLTSNLSGNPRRNIGWYQCKTTKRDRSSLSFCSREIGRSQAAPKTTLFKQRGVGPGAGRDPSRIIEHARTDPSRV